MAYPGKTNWALNEIVKPEDMNRIEQGILTLEAEKIAKDATSVGGGEDLNNCTAIGLYTWSASNASTIVNCPENTQGTMLVIPRLQNYKSNPANLTQLVITQQNNVYTRMLADGVWSAWSRVSRAADLSVGFEYFQTNPNVQAGSLPLIGGLYSRELYADLWTWVQQQDGYCITETEWQALATANNGAVPYYSSGDGETTFRVPALTVWCRGASSIEEVGDYLADSFASHKHDVSANTNITGSHSHTASTNETGGHTHTRGTMNITGGGLFYESVGYGDFGTRLSGAFYAEGTNKWGNKDSIDQDNATVEFDASRSWTGETSSNGAHSHTITIQSGGEHSHTVTITETAKGGTETRPKTIIGIYCVVAFGNVTSSGNVNLNTVQEVLEQTQQSIQAADLTNVSRYHVVGEITERASDKPTYGLT